MSERTFTFRNARQALALKPVWVACIWFFFLCAAFNIGRFALALEAFTFTSKPIHFGLYLALFPFVQWCMSAPAGRMLDVRPARHFFIASTALILAAWPLLGERSTWALVVGCVLINASSLFATLACQKFIGAHSTASDRTSNFNLFSLSATAATLVGPAIEGFVRLGPGPRYFNVSFLVFALIGAVFLVFWRGGATVAGIKAHQQATAQKHTLRLRSAFIGAGAIFGSVAVFVSYLPGLMEQQRNAAVAGFAIAAYSAGSILSRLYLPAIERRLGLDICFALMLAVASMGLAFVHPEAHLLLILVAAFVYGVGIGGSTPISSAICHAESRPENLGATMGLLSSFRKFAEMGILMTCALIPAELVGGAAFLVSAAFLLAASLISIATRPRKSGVPSTSLND